MIKNTVLILLMLVAFLVDVGAVGRGLRRSIAKASVTATVTTLQSAPKALLPVVVPVPYNPNNNLVAPNNNLARQPSYLGSTSFDVVRANAVIPGFGNVIAHQYNNGLALAYNMGITAAMLGNPNAGRHVIYQSLGLGETQTADFVLSFIDKDFVAPNGVLALKPQYAFYNNIINTSEWLANPQSDLWSNVIVHVRVIKSNGTLHAPMHFVETKVNFHPTRNNNGMMTAAVSGDSHHINEVVNGDALIYTVSYVRGALTGEIKAGVIIFSNKGALRDGTPFGGQSSFRLVLESLNVVKNSQTLKNIFGFH
jgi:hypothetical protein